MFRNKRLNDISRFLWMQPEWNSVLIDRFFALSSLSIVFLYNFEIYLNLNIVNKLFYQNK